MANATDTISLRVPSDLNQAVGELADEYRTSKSELIRWQIYALVETSGDELPDHLKNRALREMMKERNKLAHQRIHFKSNVADKFKKAFRQGDFEGHPEAIDETVDIYREDAKNLFFEDEERRNRMLDYVDALGRAARDAQDATEFSALNPDEIFTRYGGVERGEQAADTDMDELITAAQNRLNTAPGKPSRDTVAVAEVLSKEFGVTTELAKQAVETAQTGDSNA